MTDKEIDWKVYVDSKFESQDRAVTAALAAADKAVQAALISAEKAVLKKEEEVERWRAASNEWRGALSDRERDYLSRKEFYSIIGTAIAVVGLALTLYIGFKK